MAITRIIKASAVAVAAISMMLTAPAAGHSEVRQEKRITDWEFSRDSLEWSKVRVPHDWAIYGPFSRDNDLQKVTIEQNGEKEASWKTGRTGGLPYVGKGYYRTQIAIADTAARSVALKFDGAMSHARVYVNGKSAIYWPYGYNGFHVDVTHMLHPGLNEITVSLENQPKSSRWYPGAGLYRNVHLIETDRAHIPVWGTYVTTPYAGGDYAIVHQQTRLSGLNKGERYELVTHITDARGREVSRDTLRSRYYPGVEASQNLRVERPQLWSPENPALYRAVTQLRRADSIADIYQTRFGIRTIEVRPLDGFYLNGEKRKFKGVNNHHDLGPLGAAVNRSALRHQLELLKDMGADAVRTSHNMPAPELAELCDELGLMLMIEPFDDWSFRPKSENGYGTLFEQWAGRDIDNMVEAFRNHASVVMWSIGNEVPSQWGPDGLSELVMLQERVRASDRTRPVTQGMDQIDAVLDNGFAAAMEVPGFNYKTNRYPEAIRRLPQGVLLGTETASTVSSRGVYHFPVVAGADIMHADHQSSSYDVEHCAWSNLPDDDFMADDTLDYNMGQFVWTGFDYLGEPSPYDTDAWPNHSSMFGIIDLASLPKDRYYLYRSVWRKDTPTLHLLPHWTWPGREGEVTPVMVYTSYPEAELFLNGKSLGRRSKGGDGRLTRYRLIWDDVRYTPGELRVVAYDADGNAAMESRKVTAGAPCALRLLTNRTTLAATGEELAYITVEAIDHAGNPVSTADNMVTFKVKGDGELRAVANGDPTSLLPFHEPRMALFSGACTAIVQAGQKPGKLTLTATAKGLRPASISLTIK